MDKEIFTLINREDQRIQLWKDLAQAHGEILAKGKEDAVCKLKVTLHNLKNNSLVCRPSSKDKLKDSENYLGYFFLGGEKYYFQSAAEIKDDNVIVPLPSEIYHLQRRQNYRVRIPQGYKGFYNIIAVNDQAQHIKGQLVDISSQGCRVVYHLKNPLMKISDKVVGSLLIGDRAPIEIQGLVRHIKVNDGNKVIQTFGIEFSPLEPILESKLFAISMEIHKELFRVKYA